MPSLETWPHYTGLKRAEKQDATAVTQLDDLHPEWLHADAQPRIVSLRQLHHLRHGGKGLVLLPAYAQTRFVYDQHRIVEATPEQYAATPKIERVNQFDRIGASYREDLDDIFIEYRLGCIISDAAAFASEHVRVSTPKGDRSNTAILVIDGLRTVEATFAMAAANPEAVADRLLALPGKSAHNKGMAVDLTLVYWDVEHGCWVDADMLGHMDHPDMVTNHRNHTSMLSYQQYNRLQLERVMLRAAFANGVLLAPLREEFWDFRFPEDELDFWRVLESVARIIDYAPARHTCGEAITHIHAMLQSGKRAEAYADYAMEIEELHHLWQEMFDDHYATEAIRELLGVTPADVTQLAAVLHGRVNILYESDLPPEMRQLNPSLTHLFQK